MWRATQLAAYAIKPANEYWDTLQTVLIINIPKLFFQTTYNKGHNTSWCNTFMYSQTIFGLFFFLFEIQSFNTSQAGLDILSTSLRPQAANWHLMSNISRFEVWGGYVLLGKLWAEDKLSDITLVSTNDSVGFGGGTLLILFVCFWGRISPCRSSWSGTSYADQGRP